MTAVEVRGAKCRHTQSQIKSDDRPSIMLVELPNFIQIFIEKMKNKSRRKNKCYEVDIRR